MLRETFAVSAGSTDYTHRLWKPDEGQYLPVLLPLTFRNLLQRRPRMQGTAGMPFARTRLLAGRAEARSLPVVLVRLHRCGFGPAGCCVIASKHSIIHRKPLIPASIILQICSTLHDIIHVGLPKQRSCAFRFCCQTTWPIMPEHLAFPERTELISKIRRNSNRLISSASRSIFSIGYFGYVSQGSVMHWRSNES